MKKILVVDDDESILEIVQYLLESNGFEVKCLSSGLQVTEAVISFNPHLVLMDIRLPGLLGTKICEEIKQEYRIPVILFSADSSFKYLFEDSQADAFIEKPFDIHNLLRTITSLLELFFFGATMF